MLAFGTVLSCAFIAFMSVVLRKTIATPTVIFVTLWLIGMALYILDYSYYVLSMNFYAYITVSVFLVFLGETSAAEFMRHARGGRARMWQSVGRRSICWCYGIAVALATIGSVATLGVTVGYFGSIDVWASHTAEVRGLFKPGMIEGTRFELFLVSFVYLAAALSATVRSLGFRWASLLHFVPAIVVSLAISGRGPLLIVTCITLVSFAIFIRTTVLLASVRMIAGICGVALALKWFTLWLNRPFYFVEYTTGPIFGLNELLQMRDYPNYAGYVSIAALTRQFNQSGTWGYSPGDFIFWGAFGSNVSSGFQELLYDFWFPGCLVLFAVSFAAQLCTELWLRTGSVSWFLGSVALLSYLGFFYFTSLSAFLAGWWYIPIAALLFGAIRPIRQKFGHDRGKWNRVITQIGTSAPRPQSPAHR
jgi:oligosaccharide repeat unit polymerase